MRHTLRRGREEAMNGLRRAEGSAAPNAAFRSAASRLHRRLLQVRREERFAAAGRALRPRRCAVRDRAARLAPAVLLAPGRRYDRGRLSEELSDLAELMCHGDGLESGARLVRFDELLRERVEATHRFLHRDLPWNVAEDTVSRRTCVRRSIATCAKILERCRTWSSSAAA